LGILDQKVPHLPVRMEVHLADRTSSPDLYFPSPL
jgi:hypothetical protein